MNIFSIFNKKEKDNNKQVILEIINTLKKVIVNYI